KYNKEMVDNYVLGYSVPCFWPPGGMKISATDLARFMLMHMNYGQYGDGSSFHCFEIWQNSSLGFPLLLSALLCKVK
ncbi:MAG: hypothetical protein II386_08410, partial [Bacteroidaceae bacterium]|nr:hypothetical protein [Bacteroidaceae bacterium]